MLISHALHHLLTSEAGAGSNHAVKKVLRKSTYSPSLLPPPPKKEATAGAGYLIPA